MKDRNEEGECFMKVHISLVLLIWLSDSLLFLLFEKEDILGSMAYVVAS